MWYYKDQPYKEITSPNYIGFVYLITHTDPKTKEVKKYIGKKNFKSERNIKLGKRALDARTDKRASKKKKVIKESDWKRYQSSQVNLKTKPASQIKKEILILCTTKTSLTYQEAKMQFYYGVLESGLWLNKNILGRIYKSE